MTSQWINGVIGWATLTVAALTVPAVSAATQYDVVVIGGTPAGVAAAIAAGRAGKQVLLVEQAPVLGGVLSSGVARLDDGVVEANSGVMEEFRQRVKQYHLTTLANDPLVKEHLAKPRIHHSVVEGQAWEPKTAARIYAQMVAEVPTITTRFNEVPVAATVKGDRVVAVTTQARDNQGRLGAKHRHAGRVIIDATYEGDVAALAGVPFRIGREARSAEEPHAGHIYTDAFCEGQKALPGTIFPGGTGRGDEQMQAFTFRFVAKNYGRADHPYRVAAPPGYDPAKYRWYAPLRAALPNGKMDMLGTNWGGDLAGHSTRYVLAGWKERAEIEQIFRNHELGWLHYIQTEGKSPQWGLADDEFTDNGHWPYRLYVREGRRIEGLYRLTESDIHKDLRGNGLRGPLRPDAVAIGFYAMDSHNVQNPTDRTSPCSGEGALDLLDVSGPYQIPYGVMIPRNRKGLLVPVAISATHVAISSVRMEPIWSSLGQAAGVAAALALEGWSELQEVPVTRIQHALLQQRSTLFFYKDLPGDAPAFEAVQKLSLLGALEGDENNYFRREQPISMAEFAQLVLRGLEIPLSVTSAHFRDVPRGHPAFKYIETLYDYSTQSPQPFLPFEVRDYMNNWTWWSSGLASGYGAYIKDAPAFAYPDHAVSGSLAAQILPGLLSIVVRVHPDHAVKGIDAASVAEVLSKILIAPAALDRALTRGEAARLIHQLRVQTNE